MFCGVSVDWYLAVRVRVQLISKQLKQSNRCANICQLDNWMIGLSSLDWMIGVSFHMACKQCSCMIYVYIYIMTTFGLDHRCHSLSLLKSQVFWIFLGVDSIRSSLTHSPNFSKPCQSVVGLIYYHYHVWKGAKSRTLRLNMMIMMVLMLGLGWIGNMTMTITTTGTATTVPIHGPGRTMITPLHGPVHGSMEHMRKTSVRNTSHFMNGGPAWVQTHGMAAHGGMLMMHPVGPTRLILAGSTSAMMVFAGSTLLGIQPMPTEMAMDSVNGIWWILLCLLSL